MNTKDDDDDDDEMSDKSKKAQPRVSEAAYNIYYS